MLSLIWVSTNNLIEYWSSADERCIDGHLTKVVFSTHDPYGSYRVKHLLYHKDFLPFICTTLLCICQSKLHNSTIRKNELTPAVLKWHFFIVVSWFSYVKDCSVTKHYTDVSIWVGLEPCHAWYISSVYDMCFMKPCIQWSCSFQCLSNQLLCQLQYYSSF